MNLRITILLVLLGSGLTTTPTIRAADLAPASDDQLLVATAPKMKALAAAWAGCSMGRMIQSPDMQPFRAELDKHDIGSLLRLRPWFGWDWPELAEVPGNVTLKILSGPSPAPPATPPATKSGTAKSTATVAPASPTAEFVCILWKEKDDPAVAACRAAGEAYFAKLGIKPTTKQLGNITLTIYAYQPKIGAPRTTVYFGTDQYLAAATSVRGAELVIPRLQAGAAEFGISGAQGLAHFAFAPLPLAKQIIKPPAKGKRNYVRFFERQGGGEIKLVRGTVEFPSQGALELSINSELQGKFPLPKGLGVLNYQPVQAPDVSDLFGKPAHTVRHWNWDFPVAMKSVANLFDEWNEPGPSGEGLFDDLIDGLLKDPEGPQVDLRKGLFDQLGPSVKELFFTGDKNQSPIREHKIMVIACLDETAVKATLDKYYKNDKKVTKESDQGHTIWHVPPGKSLFVEGQTKNAQNFQAATVRNKLLYLADDYTALRTYLAAAAADPQIKARLSAADKASLATASNSIGYRSLSLAEHAWRVPFENLQKPPAKNDTGNTALLRWLLLGDEAARPADLGKSLPAWNKLQPLAPPTFNILNPDPVGMRLHVGHLRPDK